jgi:hypothetical protein
MLLMGGIPSLFAITELKRSYIYGNFMATVLLSQVFIEQSLGSMYAISGHDDIIGKGFAALIDMACQDGKITYELAESFHKLRRVRNPYIHHVTGLGERSYMGRIMKSDGLDPEDLVIKDAQLAVRTVADYLRQGSPDWNPGNISWNEGDD